MTATTARTTTTRNYHGPPDSAADLDSFHSGFIPNGTRNQSQNPDSGRWAEDGNGLGPATHGRVGFAPTARLASVVVG